MADHSWGTALLCMLYAELEGVDPGTAVQMAIVHDLAEAETGDIVVNSDEQRREMAPTEKSVLERKALDRLLTDVGDLPVRPLWEAFEEGSDPTARFVRDMDLLDMCLQALCYQRQGHGPQDEFFDSAAERMTTPTGKQLLAAARKEHDRIKGHPRRTGG